MEGNIAMAAALKKAIAEKARGIQKELDELGAIHRGLLARGECACTVPGSTERCAVADVLERGAEELSDRPMPTGAGNSFN